jgi:hypothetical protein
MTTNTSAYNITGLFPRDSITLNAAENNKTAIHECEESTSNNDSNNEPNNSRENTENENVGSFMQRGNQSNFEQQIAGSYSSLSLHYSKQMGNSTRDG